MDTTRDAPAPDDDALARALVERILTTGMMLIDLLTDLVEGLPDDAFPGENPAEVLVEMLAGSSVPAVVAAGPDVAERATALIAAVGECVLGDLRTAVELAARKEAA
jgi:hypothetical protein